MLEEFMGIPTHPLLVHAAVVFVPLLAISAVAYAFVPLVRPHLRWVLGLLAVATPVAALLAKLSGDAFFARLESGDRISPEFYPKLESHQQLGNLTLTVALLLGLLTLALVYLVAPNPATDQAGTTGARRLLPQVLAVLTLLAAGASLYYVVRTGDSGAKAVWTGL
ncbi:DUF2231 domain-containing protein [Plantactinospora sonchi]|uniref:DUF2231 domain-containing protein n=1 Tax=Plantactinospora sonchi TaxID=1544735 RepID=A0ABU7S3Y9_9ACTN